MEGRHYRGWPAIQRRASFSAPHRIMLHYWWSGSPATEDINIARKEWRTEMYWRGERRRFINQPNPTHHCSFTFQHVGRLFGNESFPIYFRLRPLVLFAWRIDGSMRTLYLQSPLLSRLINNWMEANVHQQVLKGNMEVRYKIPRHKFIHRQQVQLIPEPVRGDFYRWK